MNNKQSESLNKLKDYIEANKKDCTSTTMKLRDLLDMYRKKELILECDQEDYSEEQASLAIYYNLLNNSPDHLIIYYFKHSGHYCFYEQSRKRLSLLRSIILFSSGKTSFLLNLPNYPELNGYARDKKTADKLGTDKYFDKDLMDRLLNKDIFVSIITKP